MDLKTVVSSMTLEIRNNLCLAVEIGRWPDGTPLTEEQKASSMQAVIAWDSFNGEKTDEPFKVQKGGTINRTVNKSSSGSDESKTINTKSII